MISEEIQTILTTNVGRRVRLTWDDGTTQAVDIGSVEDEGFLHSGPGGIEPNFWCTRFDSVLRIEPDANQSSPLPASPSSS
jgi:hypothetical protein